MEYYNSASLLVDPNVSRVKFDRETADLLSQKDFWKKERGWLIQHVQFPIVRVVFLETRLKWRVPRFVAEVNFSDYNFLPLSVKFLHPVLLEPVNIRGIQPTNRGPMDIVVNNHVVTGLPFLCLPGVREYHTHPMHNGDSWDQYRYTHIGTLFYILENIWRYCVLALDPQFIVHEIRSSVIEYRLPVK